MHLMVDLETLGTGRLPYVLSVGWCLFNGEGIASSGEMFTTCDGNIDFDTVLWWLSQDSEARDRQVVEPRRSLKDALIILVDLASGCEGVWANGAMFDFRILREWYEHCGIAVPWHYRQECCIRSFRGLGVERVKATVAHSAEADAVAQAKYVQEVWRAVG